jgi:hypothetical protein
MCLILLRNLFIINCAFILYKIFNLNTFDSNRCHNDINKSICCDCQYILSTSLNDVHIIFYLPIMYFYTWLEIRKSYTVLILTILPWLSLFSNDSSCSSAVFTGLDFPSSWATMVTFVSFCTIG